MPWHDASKLLTVAKLLPSLTDYALSLDSTFARKNQLFPGVIELVGRYWTCACQGTIPRHQPVHYFHDTRFGRFTPEGVTEFETHPRSKWRLRDFRPFFAMRVAWIYLLILLYLGRVALRPSNGLLRLAILDLACIWTLAHKHRVTEFFFTASFQAYVVILCEMRSRNMIERLTGLQHGAWAESSLKNANRDLTLDEYRLLHERYGSVFREYFDRDHRVKLTVQEPTSQIDWAVRGHAHIAVALQYDNDEADREIVETCHTYCRECEIELIVYPHPKQSPRFLEGLQELVTVEQKLRYRDSICFVTRYSTLGMEFSLVGGAAIFVDYGEQIEFDTDGLDVRYIKPSQLQQTVAEVAAGVVLQ